MKHPSSVVSRVSLFAAAALHGNLSAIAASASIPVPCIDTRASAIAYQQMDIEPSGGPAGQMLTARGMLIGWDAKTRTVEFKSAVSNEAELIQVKSIRFAVETPSMVAQVALPTLVRRGTISLTYSPIEVRISDGIVKFPKCVMGTEGHQLAFEGTVTFTNIEVVVKGEVIDVEAARGGESSDPTKRKGG